MDRYLYFSENELRCRCECGLGQNDIDPRFMINLVDMRIELAFAFPLTSAIRCHKHNATVGTSIVHELGAADIQVYGSRAALIITNAFKFGFTGIGINQKGAIHQRFIHLDNYKGDKKTPRPWVWSY